MVFTQALRFVCWFAGASLIAWAFLDPRFRDAEGFLQTACCLPTAAGVALLILGWAVGMRWKRFAFWLALALVGQAVALQLIDAGLTLHYQHYRPLKQLLTETHPSLLAYLAAQTILVGVGLWRRWPTIRTWLGRTFKIWQLVVIASFFLLASAPVSPRVQDFAAELLFATFIQAINLGNVLLLAWALPEEALGWLEQRFQRFFGEAREVGGAAPGSVDRYALLGAAWVVVLTAALSAFSYERHPHVTDEVAYLLQARFLADGAITMPAPQVPEAFDFYLMEFKGDIWYPATPPGWPAMLALGVRLGIPWLVNPALAGLNVLLTYLLVQELYDRHTARISVLFLCLSPWFIFMGMNFMTHTFTLTCALAAAVMVVRARRTGRVVWAGLAGVMVGLGSIIRPLDGLIVGVLVGLWVIGVGGQRLKVASIAAFAIATVLIGSAVLPYNKALTGNPLVFPLNAYIDEHFGPGRNNLGFGPNRGFGWPLDPNPGHDPVDALINANLNSFSMNVELLGWSTGSLLLFAIMLVAGRRRKSDYLMITVCATVFVAFFFYYYSGGPDFGARYWYLMLVPCLVLSARGLQALKSKLDAGGTGFSSQGTRVTAAVLALCLFAAVNYLPWRAIDKYHHFWGMRPDVRYLAKAYGFGKSLVLIQGDSHPDYTSAAIYNPLDLEADAPVYAWDLSPEVRVQVVEAYRDRPVWIVSGPSITHRGFEVLEGPLAADQLLAEEQADRDVSP